MESAERNKCEIGGWCHVMAWRGDKGVKVSYRGFFWRRRLEVGLDSDDDNHEVYNERGLEGDYLFFGALGARVRESYSGLYSTVQERREGPWTRIAIP